MIPLLHHLIPVIILSAKIPITGRVLKESVKVCTPKSPPPSNDSSFDFFALDVFAHGTRAKPQNLSGLPEC
jgi:hypothetical protein